ncbi:Xylulose 5-phosphate phosphate chloroplastic [Micractinium conductrix]|uniref:Xylulose 5-phosphate phosphate chloroplastic n=1 Tax=Micractinium conductrix TaxID=554055 RepID=A0A2P6V1L0_9CHLO|nr:Xylulose 5-phosphate phosphate chloroplastic [Micractinium conductrix]|eukprot:PSC67934.1 Xylulose 5-phosphate phosphate chloroplastic [Micractinium conductrix]
MLARTGVSQQLRPCAPVLPQQWRQAQQQQWQQQPALRRRQQPAVVASAAAGGAAPVVAAAAEQPKQAGGALKITSYVFLWYAFNIVFNLLNKSTLNIFPAPWFLATFQLMASGAFMAVLWALRLQPLPQVSWADIRALAPVALFHTIGHVSACVSFSQMAVSFAHVVKAAEPVLSVVMAQVILGETYPYYVWLSLLPIIAGCSLAAMKEVSFAWSGFNNAMISNVGMVLRNIYSKKLLGQLKIDGINLFAILSIISIFYCLPCALVFEGFKGGVNNWAPLWDAAVASAGGMAAWAKLLAAGGLFYHLYNQASYMVLDQGISPVTFSVGNTMKRVAVVASSVLFFKNPVSLMNWVGSMVAMLGTGLYSLAKEKASAEAKAAKKTAQGGGAAGAAP